MNQDDAHRGVLIRREDVAEGLMVIGVAADHPFPFTPGQYATLGITGPDGALIQRPMSIASPASDLSAYEFLIRLVPGGDFTTHFWQAKAGDRLHMTGPKGRFLLEDDGRRCVFVASGTGLAPFMSMIRTLRAQGSSRDIVLLHGVSRDGDLAWRRELEDLAARGTFPLRYVPTVSRAQLCPDWRGLSGRVEAILPAQLDELAIGPDTATIYACGNPDMVEAVITMARARGFAPGHVRAELYWRDPRPA